MKKLLSVVFLAAVLAACSNTPVPEDTGAPVESRAGSGTDVKTVVAGDLDASGLPRELTDPKSQLAQRSIYFDLDRYEVKSDYQGLVAAHAKFLTANPGFRVLIQGNTDERGSREYNLGLGERRGNAASSAVQASGGSAGQLTVVSYGEERPVCTESNEECWARNRRAELVYTAK